MIQYTVYSIQYTVYSIQYSKTKESKKNNIITENSSEGSEILRDGVEGSKDKRK